MKKYYILLVIFVVISGILFIKVKQKNIEAINMETKVYIDWVDFIRMNGKDHYRIRHGFLTNPQDAHNIVGEVLFKLSDVVTSTDYEIKDSDAAYLDVGTKLYSILELPKDSYIAVKDNSEINGYRIYYSSDMDYSWHYKDVPKDRISKIEVYEYGTTTPKLKRILSAKEEVEEFIDILDKGIIDNDFMPKMSGEDHQRVRIAIYTDDKIGYDYVISYDYETYFWSPWDVEILPARIKKFIN